MSNPAIPKEQQTAYQRWELSSFGDNRSSTINEKSAQQTAISMQQLAEMAIVKEEARKSGYTEGFKKGEEEGISSGKEKNDAEIRKINLLLLNLESEISRITEVASEDILNLSIDISKAMIKSSLNINPEIILSIIKYGVNLLPVKSATTLILHPEDAALIKNTLDAELINKNWELVEDNHITRGGCKIENPTNVIDLSVETRWSNIMELFNKNSEWINNAPT
jgi:flagellar assembly protein FliH